MKLAAVLLLLVVPVAMAGDFAKLWAEMEQSVDKELFQDNAAADDSPRGDGWGDSEPKGWRDSEPKGWRDSEPKGWRDSEPKGWGDSEPKGWRDSEPKGWGELKHRGWGSRRQARDEDGTNENVQDLVFDFKQYVRRKAMKESEEKNAKAEIYRQMERLQMTKMLTDKLEQLTEKYEEKRMKFAFQTVWHFMGLCPDEGNAKTILQKLDGNNFADELFPMNDTLVGNMSGILDGNMNGTRMGNNTVDELLRDQTRVRWFVEMSQEDKVKYALYGFTRVMCSAAQQLSGEIELLHWRIKECMAGRVQCDLSP